MSQVTHGSPLCSRKFVFSVGHIDISHSMRLSSVWSVNFMAAATEYNTAVQALPMMHIPRRLGVR